MLNKQYWSIAFALFIASFANAFMEDIMVQGDFSQQAKAFFGKNNINYCYFFSFCNSSHGSDIYYAGRDADIPNSSICTWYGKWIYNS